MQKLTPHDSETIVMLHSLLGFQPLSSTYDDYYRVLAHYKHEHTPEYLSAVIDAVRGRLGARLTEIKDDAERHILTFIVNYAELNLPDVYGDLSAYDADDVAFQYFCDKEEMHAMQFTRGYFWALRGFVGGGQIRIEKKPHGKAWFTFQNNGVFVDVNEFDYVGKRPGANAYEIWPKDLFEQKWNLNAKRAEDTM